MLPMVARHGNRGLFGGRICCYCATLGSAQWRCRHARTRRCSRFSTMAYVRDTWKSEEMKMRTGNARCRRMIVGVAALMICLVSASPGSAAGKAKPQKPQMCVSDRDLAAFNARVLQTELMVAALSCDERQRYNTFVTTYQKVLTERGQALKALFKRPRAPAQTPGSMRSSQTGQRRFAASHDQGRRVLCIRGPIV